MKFVDFMADSRDFYTGLIDPVCKKYGLTQMEFNILLFLANNPECDTAARIIKKRAFTKSHVSMSVRSARTAHRGILWDGPEDDPSETYGRCCADSL